MRAFLRTTRHSKTDTADTASKAARQKLSFTGIYIILGECAIEMGLEPKLKVWDPFALYILSFFLSFEVVSLPQYSKNT